MSTSFASELPGEGGEHHGTGMALHDEWQLVLLLHGGKDELLGLLGLLLHQDVDELVRLDLLVS